MKLTKLDIILLILVITISTIFYLFFEDKLSNGYRVLIIMMFGFVVGISQRLFIDKTNK